MVIEGGFQTKAAGWSNHGTKMSSEPRPWPIQDGEIHVWLLHAAMAERQRAAGLMWDLLDEEETGRAKRFYFDRDRTLFVMAHAMTRLLLSGYLGQDPRQVRFSTGPYGRPDLVGEDRWLVHNLSHSGDSVMLGIAARAEIGVDIERIRSSDDLLDVANTSFAKEETDWISASASFDGRLDRFFTIWTMKEAYLKARGWGLNIPLNEVVVRPCPKSVGSLDAHPLDPNARGWSLFHADVFSTYRCAIAARVGKTPKIIANEFHFLGENDVLDAGWQAWRHPSSLPLRIGAREVCLA